MIRDVTHTTHYTIFLEFYLFLPFQRWLVVDVYGLHRQNASFRWNNFHFINSCPSPSYCMPSAFWLLQDQRFCSLGCKARKYSVKAWDNKFSDQFFGINNCFYMEKGIVLVLLVTILIKIVLINRENSQFFVE